MGTEVAQVFADLYIYGEGREPDIDSAIYWHKKLGKQELEII